MSIELVTLPNHFILCPPLALHLRWPKYWSFSFSISPSNDCSGLISFRVDSFDLLAVQGTVESLLQHNSKASILWDSAFFMVQLSHPYMTTGKAMALIIRTFVCKVMSLLFNTLSGFVIAFLPRSKHLNFVAAITIRSDFGAQENKICHCFHFFPICLPLSDGTGCHDLIFLMMSFKPAFSLSFLSGRSPGGGNGNPLQYSYPRNPIDRGA